MAIERGEQVRFAERSFMAVKPAQISQKDRHFDMAAVAASDRAASTASAGPFPPARVTGRALARLQRDSRPDPLSDGRLAARYGRALACAEASEAFRVGRGLCPPEPCG
jgi:hypothetical protein